jgi:hypothetical protein
MAVESAVVASVVGTLYAGAAWERQSPWAGRQGKTAAGHTEAAAAAAAVVVAVVEDRAVAAIGKGWVGQDGPS